MRNDWNLLCGYKVVHKHLISREPSTYECLTPFRILVHVTQGPSLSVPISCSTLASSLFPRLMTNADMDLDTLADWHILNKPGMVFWVTYDSETAPPTYCFSAFPCSGTKMKLWLIPDHRGGWFYGRMLSPKSSCYQSSPLPKNCSSA